MYECPVCGLVINRDLNAAINLEKYLTVSSAGSDACGDKVQLGLSVKQELKTIKQVFKERQ